jgi:hypothetical protein
MTAKDDVENAAVGDGNIENLVHYGNAPEEASQTRTAVGGLSAPEAAKEAPQRGTSQVPQQLQQKPGSKSKKEVNPDFKELRETGSWGKLSRSEFHVVMGVVAMIVIAVVVLVVLVLTHVIGHKDKSVPAPTLSPVVVATGRETLLKTILAALHSSNNTELAVETLPNSVAYYQNKADGSAGYKAQAMSWLLYSDEFNHDDDFVDQVRYALAALYYAFGGPKWFNTTDWLTSTDFCLWHGILCNIQGNVTELDLHSNNLVGTIPPELSLMTTLIALNLANNHLTGTLPGYTIAADASLGIINVANNSLTGTIPDNLLDGGNYAGE